MDEPRQGVVNRLAGDLFAKGHAATALALREGRHDDAIHNIRILARAIETRVEWELWMDLMTAGEVVVGRAWPATEMRGLWERIDLQLREVERTCPI